MQGRRFAARPIHLGQVQRVLRKTRIYAGTIQRDVSQFSGPFNRTIVARRAQPSQPYETSYDLRSCEGTNALEGATHGQ